MQAYICGQSALDFYRANRFPKEVTDDTPEHLRLEDAARNFNDVGSVYLAGLDLPEPTSATPLHLLVPSEEHRGAKNSVKARVWCSELPTGSFYKGNAYASISTPEFLFVQMARDLSLVELVELGMELCGSYRRACEKYPTRYECAILTTPKKMKDFIEGAGKMPGVKKARQALKHIVPESASPMETVTYLLLCLPRRLGGYAFPRPILNQEVPFSAAGKKFTLRRSSYPDLCWPDSKIDLEYHGSEHEKDERRAEDSMRRKALERMGYTVYELTYKEVENIDLFHANVRRLANLLGLRLRSAGEGNFRDREAGLRATLLGSNKEKLLESEDNYWRQVGDTQKSLREIAESYGVTELPSEYDSWEAFFGLDPYYWD